METKLLQYDLICILLQLVYANLILSSFFPQKRSKNLVASDILHITLYTAVSSLMASWPQAASISSPRLRRTLVTICWLRRYSANCSILSASAFTKSANPIGLYSMIFTLHGTCLQNRASSFASCSSSLKL